MRLEYVDGVVEHVQIKYMERGEEVQVEEVVNGEVQRSWKV